MLFWIDYWFWPWIWMALDYCLSVEQLLGRWKSCNWLSKNSKYTLELKYESSVSSVCLVKFSHKSRYIFSLTTHRFLKSGALTFLWKNFFLQRLDILWQLLSHIVIVRLLFFRLCGHGRSLFSNSDYMLNCVDSILSAKNLYLFPKVLRKLFRGH